MPEQRGQLRVVGAAVPPGPEPRVVAALRSLSYRDLVISHSSAAQYWGLPAPIDGWGPVTLTGTSGSARTRAGTRVRVAPLPTKDVVLRDGFDVTTPARTVADCLRTLPPADALAVADAALRRRITTAERVGAVLDVQTGWPGVRNARRLVGLADGRRESPLESASAWVFTADGLDQPRWQVTLLALDGRFVARTDCWWDEGLAGEADGKAKYRLAAAEHEGADSDRLDAVLHDERRREEGIRRLGADVVRWGMADLRQDRRRTDLCSLIRERRLAAGRARTFRGRAIHSPAA